MFHEFRNPVSLLAHRNSISSTSTYTLLHSLSRLPPVSKQLKTMPIVSKFPVLSDEANFTYRSASSACSHVQFTTLRSCVVSRRTGQFRMDWTNHNTPIVSYLFEPMTETPLSDGKVLRSELEYSAAKKVLHSLYFIYIYPEVLYSKCCPFKYLICAIL
jgi:hypothetical protein